MKRFFAVLVLTLFQATFAFANHGAKTWDGVLMRNYYAFPLLLPLLVLLGTEFVLFWDFLSRKFCGKKRAR